MSIGWIVFLVALGSAYLLFVRDPDKQVVVSPDGFFRFSAMTAPSIPRMSVDRTEGGPSTARLSPIYSVTPSIGLPASARVSLKSDLAPSGVVLARFWEEVGAWEPLPTRHLLDRFSADLQGDEAWTGSFALIKSVSVDSPPKEQLMLETLLAEAPENAVSGEVFMAYSLAPDDFVLIPSYKKVLSCEENTAALPGLVLQTNTLVQNVTIGERSFSGAYSLIARWHVGEAGCASGLVLATP
ncbi:hypothetical protein HYW18_00015 [Candidatus Uhrbacteria bacterium]|nr:hypothetical protein [Candidatus Uhrbacteria bacterium]